MSDKKMDELVPVKFEHKITPLALSDAELNNFGIQNEQTQYKQIKTNHKPYTRLGLLVLILTFGIFGGWASTAPLDSAAVAYGEVIVTSNNRVVEHYEGGIVQKILVKDGDKVDEGQVLLRLAATQAQSELDVVNSRLYEILGAEARLQAEQKGNGRIKFPEELMKLSQKPQVAQIIRGQKEVFQARKRALSGELIIYRKQIAALQEQIRGIELVNRTLAQQIISYANEVADWEALYKQQFADKIRLQEARRELERLKGNRNSNLSDMARLRVQISETQSEISLRQRQFSQDVLSELRDIQGEKSDLLSRRTALADRLQRVDIVSPIGGTVNGLKIYTAGEVVSPGEPLMEIVPNSQEFAIKAKVNTTDIDKVKVGLIADVRFSAFNTQITHVVQGEVVYLSADKFVDEKNNSEYFEARVVITPEGVAQMKEDGIFLLPGMPAETIIKTGERTLMAYFVKPFKDMFAKSFNED